MRQLLSDVTLLTAELMANLKNDAAGVAGWFCVLHIVDYLQPSFMVALQ